jgi:hypothetical protein
MIASAPTFVSNCTGCHAALGSTTQPVRLLDLTFHAVCAPRCEDCGTRHGGTDDETRWRYSARSVSDWHGYRAEPSTFWCEPCWQRTNRSAFGSAPGTGDRLPGLQRVGVPLPEVGKLGHLGR